jgi:hypothetical protein
VVVSGFTQSGRNHPDIDVLIIADGGKEQREGKKLAD